MPGICPPVIQLPEMSHLVVPDPDTFTGAFRRRFGCTPTAFLNGYQPMP